MRRRARPSARTTRTAPTAPCVPVARDGARVPRSVPPDAGPVTGNGSCTSVEGGSERSTGSPGGPRDSTPRRTDGPALRVGRGGDRRRARARRWPPWRSTCVTYVDRFYDHFVWQAAAFLEGQAAIRYPVEAAGGLLGQRLLPGRPARSPRPTASPRGLLPFPPLPALSSCRSSRCGASRPTTRRSSRSSPRSTSRSAGGRSGGCRSARRSASATTVFFAFGTVFWYTAQLVDDLVPGPHRGGRADVPGDRHRARRGPEAADEPTADEPPDDGRRSTRPPGRRRIRPLARRAAPVRSPASCSGWPARPA